MKSASTTNTRKVAANSIWFGVESAFEIFTGLATSIIMARTFGPERLGYFNYVMWLTNLSGVFGSLGLPGMCRKYMAEFLGQGRHDMARAVFEFSLRRHALLSAILTAAGLSLVATVVAPEHRTASALQVLSLLPSMLRFLPSQANLAREDMRANLPGSIIGQSCFIVFVLGSIWLGFGLEGIAAGILTARTVECILRGVPVMRWIRSLPVADLSVEQAKRLFAFARDNTFTLIVNLVVWDRSDMIFLERLVPQRAEISFFNVAFNLTDKMLIIPGTLSKATGTTMFAQYGRDPRQLPSMAAASLKYVLLLGTPLLLGMSSLSPVLVPLVYGEAFRPAAAALSLATVLALFRGLILPGFNFIQAIERQRLVMWCTLACAVVNIGLDLTLIPRWKALGAVAANGVAQTLSVAGIWAILVYVGKVKIPWRSATGILLSGTVMALGVSGIIRLLPAWLGIAASIPAGALMYLGGIRIFGVLDQTDRQRLKQIEGRLPAPVRHVWDRSLNFLVAPGA